MQSADHNDPQLRKMLSGDADRGLLLIAVATGNAIANLPPILECATRGDDAVLWLETPEARRGKWSDGPTAILRGRGIRAFDPVPIPDEPQGCLDSLASAFTKLLPHWHPVFVGNGGTKPLSGAIGEALRLAAPTDATEPYATIYGQSPGAELWLLPEGPVGPLSRRRYSHRGLTLIEFLQCSGHVLFDDLKKPLTKIWPHAAEIPTIPYGTYPKATAASHQRHHEWDLYKKAAETELADYKMANHLFHEEMSDWRNRLKTGIGTEEALFNKAKKLAVKGGQEAVRRRAGATPPDDEIGTPFEQAVARRVQNWLRSQEDAYPITEAWWSAHIARATRPDVKRAELDIVFVLANGILLSLECKTAIVKGRAHDAALTSVEQLNARLLNLQATASQLARLTICWPLYTQFATDDWFKRIHREVDRNVKPLSPLFRTIGFTLPDQPTTYTLETIEGGTPVIQTLTCPPFEEALGALLAPYRVAGK